MTESELKARVRRLGLYGLLADWDAVARESWLLALVEREETERRRRGLERRLRRARLGRFKTLADFDWNWPKKIDREQVEDLVTLDFLTQSANVVLVGPNGVGKSMIAQNLAHTAAEAGHAVRWVTASELLNDLAAQDGSVALQRRFGRYARPRLLVIDELGYLSYDNRHADLLFEVVSRRYGNASTIVTTNKPFAEWNQVFPNAACVVTLIDRLVHNAEIVTIEGASYRLKEAKELAGQRAKERAQRRRPHPPRDKEKR
jgi:DNA replication protein DnaC